MTPSCEASEKSTNKAYYFHFLSKLPSFLVPVLLCVTGHNILKLNSYSVAIACFMIHYAQRSLIYPCLVKGGKATPVHTFSLALVFCTYNGFLQTRYHQVFQPSSNDFSLWQYTGFVLFVTGLAINIHSDAILRNLRQPGESGYRIPYGGLFRLVSCANFTGEILEWIGYALLANTLAAWSFAAFTFLNLAPRGLHHHMCTKANLPSRPFNRIHEWAHQRVLLLTSPVNHMGCRLLQLGQSRVLDFCPLSKMIAVSTFQCPPQSIAYRHFMLKVASFPLPETTASLKLDIDSNVPV